MLAFGLKSQLDNTSLEKPLNKIIEARGWVDGKTFVRDVSGWRERVGKTRLTEKGGEEARDELTLLLAIAVIDTQPVERGLELAYREVRHHETRCSVLSVVGRVAAGASPAQNLPLYRGRTRNLPD